MAAMKYRPLIGINTDYRASAKGRTPHCYIHSGYFDCLLAANALPVFIPPLIKESDLTPILDRWTDVMLTGGDDLDPRKMGLSPHPVGDRHARAPRAGRPPALQDGPTAPDARAGHRAWACRS